ncbi:Uncharacterized protein Rs2_49545 [Raphanus sativus]|nr:Uncharacterized protein Rs2_49545 [Raphanus sativus]
MMVLILTVHLSRNGGAVFSHLFHAAAVCFGGVTVILFSSLLLSSSASVVPFLNIAPSPFRLLELPLSSPLLVSCHYSIFSFGCCYLVAIESVTSCQSKFRVTGSAIPSFAVAPLLPSLHSFLPPVTVKSMLNDQTENWADDTEIGCA